jgi:hypothetical protein
MNPLKDAFGSLELKTESLAKARDAPGCSTPMTGPSAALRQDHEQLGRSLARLVDFVRAEDTACAREEWADLEIAVLRHLDGEEMFLLPGFERENARAAKVIRAEHADIRRRLGEIGVSMDLHTLRAEHVDQLRELLTRHAVNEDGSLYAWVAQGGQSPMVEAIARRHDSPS